MLRTHSKLFEQLTLAADLILIAACWLLAYELRFHVVGPPLRATEIPFLSDYLLQLVPILLVWGFAFRWFGLYRPRRLGSYLAEWKDIAKASTLGVLVLVTIMTFVFKHIEYSRVVILYFWVLSIIAVSFWRAIFRECLRFARRRGMNLRYALIVGGSEPATHVARMLRNRPDIGVQILGVVGEKPEAAGPITWLGELQDLRHVLDSRAVDMVFVALPHADYGHLRAILDVIGDDPVTIHLVPDVYSFASLRGGTEEIDGVPLIHLRDSPLHGWNRLLKRLFDLVVGSAALVVVSPLMLLIALGVKLISGRPVLYSQERMGLDGRRFRMLKFRTMQVDAEAETGPIWTSPDDPRRTAFGAFLRRWSLDELPQFFNVLRGEMSLVGPRPERPPFVEEFRRQIPGYMLRHKVKAGMTGLAQIKGWRGSTSLEKRIEQDLSYIENWSLWLDFKIVLMTFWKGLTNKNAY